LTQLQNSEHYHLALTEYQKIQIDISQIEAEMDSLHTIDHFEREIQEIENQIAENENLNSNLV
jgi:hypothetical protein